MNMAEIDFHTHILPGIDDGAKTPEVSLRMLDSLRTQGISTVVLTSHYYSHKMHMQEFLQSRQQAFTLLCSHGGAERMALRLASETYLTDYLFNEDDITPLCIEGTRYLLTELPFRSSFGSSALQRLQRLIGNYSVTPILAHVERYEPIMHDKGVANELLDMGCLMQVNISSFSTKVRSEQKSLLRMCKNGYIHLLGTDCHNMDSRSPDMQQGLAVIQKKLGEDYLAGFAQNAKQVLHNN